MSLQGKTPTFTGYKLQDRYTFQGMDLSIENKKGSIREWKDRNGQSGETKMLFDYGYIRNTLGNDGDHQDCYVGDNSNSEYIYVVHQLNQDGDFDEDKCFLGFNSREEAKAAYVAHIPEDRFGGIIELSIADFIK